MRTKNFIIGLAAALLASVGAKAQTANVNLTAAGTLQSVAGITTVQKLTLTGVIDARDVRFMRDSMTNLTELDLSGAAVVAYSGTEGTSSSTSSVTYPANEMPQYSFYSSSEGAGKTSLTSVKLPASLTSIGNYAFRYCSGLSGSLTLPENLTSIGNSAFAYCSNLSGDLTLPTSLTSIGNAVFFSCRGLDGSLSLPEGLTSIGNQAFYYCSGLSSKLVLPASLTSIGSSAFYRCSGFTSVTNLSLTPQSINSDVFQNVNIENIVLTVPTSSATLYGNAAVWSSFKNVSGGGVLLSVKINNSALGSISGTVGGLHPANTNVGLIANPTSGYSLLSWTSDGANLGVNTTLSFTLTKDTAITANFGKAGNYNLTAAGTLKDISGIKTVTRLTLTGVIDARDVRFMRDSMPALTELDLSGASVAPYSGEEGTRPGTYVYPANEMPQYSFYSSSEGTGKMSLISVKLPASLISIGTYAFRYCSGLSGSLTLPAGLTSIGSSAFAYCAGLSGNLTLPKGLTSMGNSVFFYCRGLSGNLTLPEGLTSMGNQAFYNCSGLSGSLILPEGLTSIGSTAFYGCSGFTSVTNLNLTPQNISSDVFGNVSTGDIVLTVPTSSVALYENADVWRDFKSVTGGGMLLSVKSNNGALGSVSGTLGGLHPANTAVVLIAAPASGYSLLSWTSGGATLGTNATLSFTLTKDTAITANFGKAGSYNLTAAGTLKDISGIKAITHLTLTGVIDARDVRLMRDSMIFLTELDLSGASVVAYSGEEGTISGSGTYVYPANEMPQYSFYSSSEGTGKMSLISVKLPASLTSIGTYAFRYCSRLSGSLTLPTGLTSIGITAFYNCSGLSGSLILPTGLTSIGAQAFAYCSNLSGDLTLPTGLTSIGTQAFFYCSGLSGSLVLPEGLTSIGISVFYSCSGFTSVTNLSLTPQIISNIFGNVSIENIVLTVPTSSVALYENADVWRDFKSVTGGGMLLSVKSNNGALGSVSGTLGGLHPTNTSVGLIANPASGYSLLSWTSGGANLGTNATLSFTLTKDTAITANFGKAGSYNLTAAGTLRDISGIKTVSHLTLTGIIDARDVQLMRDSMPALTELNLSGANVVAYEGEEGTMSGTYDYPTNEMPQYSFYSSSEGTGKTSLISVKLPASLTSIGSYAFAYCRGLSGSMTLPTGLTSIGASAFYNCSSLSGSLILPTGLTSIGSDAFANCSGLSGNLTLPEGLISIGNSVFANCRELSGSLILPAGLTSIGNDAFASCSGLSSLSLPAGLISIGDYAFYNCSGLSGSLTLPEGLTSIGSYAFANCSGLSGSLTLPEVSTSIGIGAFASCSGLSDSLILPENLTSIGSEAFAYCSGLSSLTLPADLTSIGDYAFYNCSGLSGDLTLPAGLTSIGSWAFYGCSGFTSVTNLSLTPQSISSDVFGNVSISSIALRVPATSLAAYQSAQVWRDFYPIAGGVTLRIEINNSAWGTVTGAANGWLPANAAVSLTAIPAQGYVFEGWTSGGASLGASDSLAFILTQDTVITAGFRPSGSVTIYTVTFNANGGSAVNQQTVAAGGKVPQVAAPTRSGYIFDGWCSDAALTSFWNFATGTVTGDMTLYARWRVQPATGVESHTLGVARVYPNPTSGVVIVESGGAEVLLYSLQGALLERTFGSHLDLSSYPSGVYVLKAGNKAARIVKQ